MDILVKLLEDASNNKTIVICVDEFDTILMNCDEFEANKIQALLLHLIEKPNLPVQMLFTMTRLPETFVSPNGDLVVSKSEIIKLSSFPREDIKEMITTLLIGHVSITTEAMDYLIELSGCYPYFVKLLLDRLLARYWSEDTKLSVTREMIEYIIPDSLSDPRTQAVLDGIFELHFSQQEKELFRFLCNQETSINIQKLENLGVAFVEAVETLVERGHVRQNNIGHYEICNEFLRIWVNESVDKL
jgi:hypothetical protein